MSKERLKEIQEKYDMWSNDFNLEPQDVEWLIEQVKRASVLEITIDFYQSALRDADRRVHDLVEECAGWKEASRFNDEKLEQQNKRYREALEFYAEQDNYRWEISYRPQQEIDCMVIDDGGHTARKALKGDKQ